VDSMGMVNWGFGRKLAPLSTNWARVSTGNKVNLFGRADELSNWI